MSIDFSLGRNDIFLLRRAIHSALLESLRNADKKTEPQVVANLVYNLPKFINSLKFEGVVSVSCGGVFVHSSPLVSCDDFPEKNPKSVEVGDVLMVVTFLDRGRIIKRRAMLLQVKKVNGFVRSPDNKNQWHLYKNWPEFKYEKRSGALQGQFRRIRERGIDRATKYLLIDQSGYLYHSCRYDACCCFGGCGGFFCSTSFFTVFAKEPFLSGCMSFCCDIINLMSGFSGKRFYQVLPGCDGNRGWSRVVYDLITETAYLKSKFMEQVSGDGRRGREVFFMSGPFLTIHPGFLGNNELFFVEEVPEVGPREGVVEGGVSLIEFVVHNSSGC